MLRTSTMSGGSSSDIAADQKCCPQSLNTFPPCRSLEETVALVNGVEACGGGKWADIKKRNYRAIEHRSAVSAMAWCWGCLLQPTAANLVGSSFVQYVGLQKASMQCTISTFEAGQLLYSSRHHPCTML